MSQLPLVLWYSLLIVLASLLGGWLPSRVRLDHVRMQLVMSMVGGLMLGIGLLHLLPHSYAATGSLDRTLGWTLAGLLGMFFLIRTFQFHHHGPTASVDAGQAPFARAVQETPPENEAAPVSGEHGHGPSHSPDHGHGHGHGHGHAEQPRHQLSWMGVALGLALHTLIDGVAVGAAVVADAAHQDAQVPAGFGVFLAVLLHKPLDALSITTLMAAGGRSRRSRWLVNGAVAAMCPLGAMAVVLGFSQAGGLHGDGIGMALGLAAGAFLCISLSDLLPEVQFHSHDRFKLSLALLAGVLVAFGIGFFESEHAHHAPGERVGHDHSHPHPHHHGD